MPQPKKFETSTDQKRAWNIQNMQRIELSIRRNAELNKTVLQKAAKDGGVSVSQLLTHGALLWIEKNLGAEWFNENRNTQI